MPSKSTGLATKPRAYKARSGGKRLSSSSSKPPDQRRIRIPVLGGGKQVSKPRRRVPKKVALPGCLLSITGVLLGVMACIVFVVML